MNCIISALHPDHLELFSERYAKFAPNYYFNPKYKLGQWDGKIRYFQKTGKTYINLLDEIVPDLIALRYDIEIKDRRELIKVTPDQITEHFFSNITNPETNQPWVLRDYQVELVNALLASGSGIGIAATGSGKTAMTAAIAQSYANHNLRTMTIVPDKNLVAQTRSEFLFFGLDAGEYSGVNKDIQHTHIVSTWQALQNNPQLIQTVDVVIVDECHKLKGQILTKLLNDYGKNIRYRFGVTGTLPNEEVDALAVKIAVGSVHYNVGAKDLIDQGHLAKLHIDIIQLQVNLKEDYQQYLAEQPELQLTYNQFKDQYFPDWPSEKRFLQTHKQRLAWIATYIEEKRDARKGNVLCLVDSINLGKKLHSLVEDSEFVYGHDDIKTRQKVYDLFKESDNLVVFATVHIAGTGLNIKRIFNLMFIDVGKSFIRTIQTIGRGLRKAPDKDFVSVTDICSDLKYGKRHLRERIKYYNQAQYPHKKHTVDYDQ